MARSRWQTIRTLLLLSGRALRSVPHRDAGRALPCRMGRDRNPSSPRNIGTRHGRKPPPYSDRIPRCAGVSPPVSRSRRGVRDSEVCFRSEEHTSELQSSQYLVCRLLLEKKKKTTQTTKTTELTQTPHRQPTVAVTHKVSDF